MPLFGFQGSWPADAVHGAHSPLSRETMPHARSVQHTSLTLPNGYVQAPALARDTQGLAIMSGQPVWRSPAGYQPFGDLTDAAARFLTRYREVGRKALDDLHGCFGVVVLDFSGATALLAVDRMGIEKLAFSITSRGLAFASTCDPLVNLLGKDTRLRAQAIYDYLLMHMVPSPQSAFESIDKLRAGTCLEVRGGKARVDRYWDPLFCRNAIDDNEEAALGKGLHRALDDSVRRCQPDERTGAFLSGGLDSSTVAGVLARVRPGGARTFSIGFGVEAYNELDYARIAVRHFGLDSTEYHVTANDIVEAFPLIARTYDEPFGNSSAVPTYFCAKLARDHGVTRLLAGDGGDELFGGNERYGRQRVFEAYWKLPRALRQGILEPLTRLIPQEFPVMPLRKLRSYVDQARIPLPERFEAWNFMYRADVSSMLDPEFMSAIDTRAVFRNMSDVYESAGDQALLDKMLFYDWQFTLSDNDLRKVGAMCGLAGVEVLYPMLSPEVIDLSLRVPPARMMRGTDLRSFYKSAMKDFLPREIIEKKKHGFGLPFGVWLKTHAPLQDLIFSHLEGLKARGIVRREFLDRLMADQRDGHPGYFGYAIWDLAMLEAWLQAHPAG